MIEVRKFSAKRLYKLIKRVVIIATALSALILMLSIYMYNTGAHDVYKTLINSCDSLATRDDYYYVCRMDAAKVYDFWSNALIKSLLITIMLPVTFFGSVSIYRYLFPKA